MERQGQHPCWAHVHAVCSPAIHDTKCHNKDKTTSSFDGTDVDENNDDHDDDAEGGNDQLDRMNKNKDDDEPGIDTGS